MNTAFFRHIFIGLPFLILTACANGKFEQSENSGLHYAKLLNMEEHQGYTRVEVRTKATDKPTAVYVLVENGTNVPDNLQCTAVITVPVRSLAVNSSVYAFPMQELGVLNKVKGVTDAAYFTMPEIKKGLANGTIVDLGNALQPTVEKIIELKPDGILVNLYEGMQVSDLPMGGVPYIKFADNLEATPLGRAEWIKFLGQLTGRRAEADSIFNEVVIKYNALKSKVANVQYRPKVLTENMYEGVWYVPAGKSVAAQMLVDAGAEWPWISDTGNGSLALSFEEVLEKEEDADVWMLKMFGIKLTQSTLLKMDSRYSRFKPLQKGNVWYSETATSGLYDVAAFHPEQLLDDYIIIFHPKQSEGRMPRFYRRMGVE